MKKTKLICLVLIIISIVYLHDYLKEKPEKQIKYIYLEKECPECKCKNETVVITEIEYRYLRPKWEELLLNFSMSHKYDKYNYNCVDYSRDAVKLLRKHGYMAYQVKGHCKHHPPNMNHAWVEIRLWYEPKTGQLIPYDKCRLNM